MNEDRSLGLEALMATFARFSEPLFLVDGTRRILDLSEAACTLFGRSRAALLEGGLPELPESVWAFATAGTSGRIEIEVPFPGRGRATMVASVTPNTRPGQHLLLLRDITAQRQREAMSERYKLLARHTHDIVLFLDREGRIVEANDAAVSAYGYAREELLRLSVADLRTPDTRFEVEPQMEKAFVTGVLLETIHRRKDGTEFPVEVGSRNAMVDGEQMLLSTIRDITDRRQIQAGLVQADRLSTFGMMAAGIAHEINNPLAYSITNIDVLARRLTALSSMARGLITHGDAPAAAELSTGLEQCAEMILIAQEGMGRVRSIVRDLKMFSRDDAGAQERIDLRAILESSINIARGEIRHRARVVRDYGEIPFVTGSASRLGQVFLNLLVNAAQAITEGRSDGEIRVVTRTAEHGDAIVEVVDNGVGIPESEIDRIFDPFVTTKPDGEGTGLGLHIARTITRAAGGDVRASSRVGTGTTMS
ncbi:MAG: ATP-binding protein, partial [Polyangiaceae bacterium]